MKSAGTRSIARNAAFLSLSQGIGIAARLIYVFLVARLLGPDLYAVLAYSQAWHMAFLPIALFGLGSAMVWSIAPDHERAAEVAANGLAIRLLTTAIAAVACLMLSRVIAPDPRAPALIAVLTIALVARAFAAWAQHLFVAFEKTQYTLRQQALFRVVDLVVATVVLLNGGGLLLLVSAQAVVWCLQASRGIYLVRRDIVRFRFAFRPDQWRPLLAIAFPFLLIAWSVDWRMTGTLVLFRNLTNDGILFGQFALAMQAFFIASALPASLGAAAQPILRRSAQREDGKDLLYARAVQRVGIVGGAGLALAGMALGEPLFSLILGDDFARAGELVGLTLWCMIPLMIGNAYPPLLIARGQFSLQVIASLIGAAVMTALMFALVPDYGAHGAVASAFAGLAVPSLLIYVQACRQRLAAPGADLFRPLLAVGAALACYRLSTSLPPWSSPLVGLLVLVIATAVLGVVGPEQIRRLRRLV